MVPKVAGKGKSFKGAGLYYLHDKQASTAERVAFTQTRNLATDDAEFAIRLMAYTAMRQAQIKAGSGAAVTGRKLVHSVYCYSLSWAPDEAPTQEEMLEAAHETLEALGVADHEALLVSHNDEPHPHIHVILNRVHPETGLAAKLACDHLILSRWAEGFERRQGQIRCDERVENNKRRRDLKAKVANGFVKHKQKSTTAEHRAARKSRLKNDYQARQKQDYTLDLRPPSPHDQRHALYGEKEARIEGRREQIRAANRPKWAALYKRQNAEIRLHKKNLKFGFYRLRQFFKDREKGQSVLAGAIKAFVGRTDLTKTMAARHETERKALAKEVRRQNREAIRQENAAYREELNHLKQLQAQETRSLKQTHAKQSQDLAREIKQRADAREDPSETQRSETLREEFEKRVGRRIRKARKRGGRGKGHGRERE